MRFRRGLRKGLVAGIGDVPTAAPPKPSRGEPLLGYATNEQMLEELWTRVELAQMTGVTRWTDPDYYTCEPD